MTPDSVSAEPQVVTLSVPLRRTPRYGYAGRVFSRVFMLMMHSGMMYRPFRLRRPPNTHESFRRARYGSVVKSDDFNPRCRTSKIRNSARLSAGACLWDRESRRR